MKKMPKLSITKLFYNNKFVFVFSVLAAFAIWAAVVLNLSPEDERVIENIKVVIQDNVDESSGLQIFGYEDTYVDVTVTGKRYSISTSALSAEDISVVAKGGYIDSPGKYTLDVTASAVDGNAPFDIVSVTQNSEPLKNISVYYDTHKTEEFNVSVELTANNGIVPDGFIYDDPISSLTTASISGPATEINKIDRVVAYATLESAVEETVILNADVVALTSNNSSALNYITYNDDTAACTVTLPVYMTKTVDLSVRFLNRPSSFKKDSDNIVITPSQLKVAASKSVLDEIDTLSIGSINFSKMLDNKNNFIFNVENIGEVRVLDDVKEISVDVDFSHYTSRVFAVPQANITCLNVPEAYNVAPLTSINSVKVIGPAASLEALTDADVLAKIDFSGVVMKEGAATQNADVYLKNDDVCWVYGSYTGNVSVTKK